MHAHTRTHARARARVRACAQARMRTHTHTHSPRPFCSHTSSHGDGISDGPPPIPKSKEQFVCYRVFINKDLLQLCNNALTSFPRNLTKGGNWAVGGVA